MNAGKTIQIPDEIKEINNFTLPIGSKHLVNVSTVRGSVDLYECEVLFNYPTYILFKGPKYVFSIDKVDLINKTRYSYIN